MSENEIYQEEQALQEETVADASPSTTAATATTRRSGPVQSTRSYMFLDSAGSMLYEKDGNWLLEKLPPMMYQAPKKTKVNANNASNTEAEDEEDDENANDKTYGGQLDLGLVVIDTLTSAETNPCNLCDKPSDRGNDIAPLWTWIYNMVVQIVGKAKEIKKDMVQKDAACGRSENASGVDGLVSSKGTQK